MHMCIFCVCSFWELHLFCYGLCELNHNHEPPNLQVNSTTQTSQDIACEQAKKVPLSHKYHQISTCTSKLAFFQNFESLNFLFVFNSGATRTTKNCSPLTHRDPFWQPFASLPNGNRYFLIGRQSEEEIFIWSAWQVKPLLGNWSLRTKKDRWTSSCFSVSEWRPGGCRVYIYTCICLDLHMYIYIYIFM